MSKLSLLLNNEVVYDHDRDIHLEDQQLAFLDKMDADMSKGIKISGQLITNPDEDQRLKFIVLNLIKGLKQENEAVISSSTAYLVARRPALVEVHITDGDSGIDIEFVDEQVN